MNEKPKLIRITTVPGSLNGLLKGQLKFMSQYYEVVGISSQGEALSEVEINEGVKVISLLIARKPKPLADIMSIYRLFKIFRKEKPTIVHSHTPKAGMVSMVAAYLAGVPVRLHTVAGLPLMTRKGIFKRVLILVEKITYIFAHKVYPNSIGLKNYIESLKIVNPKKMKVIGFGSSNGVDLDFFNPELVKNEDIESIKKEYNIEKNDYVFITIGRIVKDKGINELLSAFRELSEKHNNMKLMLLGDFEDILDPIKRELKDYALNSSKVVLAGYKNDIRPFLKIATVFIHPSFREGFPNVVMQACTFNKPVIVTNINGSNEIIKNRVNGLVIPAGDKKALIKAMLEFYSDFKLMDKLSKNNRQIMLEKYSRWNIWQLIKEEYDSMLADFS